MEEKLRESEDDNERVARAQGRQEHRIADEVETNVDKSDEQVDTCDEQVDDDRIAECYEEIQLEDLDGQNSNIFRQ